MAASLELLAGYKSHGFKTHWPPGFHRTLRRSTTQILKFLLAILEQASLISRDIPFSMNVSPGGESRRLRVSLFQAFLVRKRYPSRAAPHHDVTMSREGVVCSHHEERQLLFEVIWPWTLW